jgi:hypothetical protein
MTLLNVEFGSREETMAKPNGRDQLRTSRQEGSGLTKFRQILARFYEQVKHRVDSQRFFESFEPRLGLVVVSPRHGRSGWPRKLLLLSMKLVNNIDVLFHGSK